MTRQTENHSEASATVTVYAWHRSGWNDPKKRALCKKPGLEEAVGLNGLLESGEMIHLPAPQGELLIDYRPGDHLFPILTDISGLLKAMLPEWGLGIHQGPIHPMGTLPGGLSLRQRKRRMAEIQTNGEWLVENCAFVRAVRNLAEWGCPGHILVLGGESVLGAEFEQKAKEADWRMTPLGEHDLEPLGKVQLFNLFSLEVGRQDVSSIISNRAVMGKKAAWHSLVGGPVRIALFFKPETELDEPLAYRLKQRFEREGWQVVIGQNAGHGLAWAEAIDALIREVDFIMLLISAESMESEMLAYKVEMARANESHPRETRLLPLRVDYTGPLPQQLNNLVSPLEFSWDNEEESYRAHYLLWRQSADEEEFLELLCGKIRQRIQDRSLSRRVGEGSCDLAVAPPVPSWEPLGGAVPLDSRFYIVREVDHSFAEAVRRRDGIVLLKGARQMGKTSLLARGLEQARQAGATVLLSDFQKLHPIHFQSLRNFYIGLSKMISRQLGLEHSLEESWEERLGPNANFERFWTETVFPRARHFIVWGCDEFDRLFGTDFGSEVCGLFRSWYNERVLAPDGPWARFSIAIAFATEAHLFITNLDQSPFNVGTRLTLSDLTMEQVAELNRRYGEPLGSRMELGRLYRLVGGHPYLVRRALQELADRRLPLEELEREALDDEGPFVDHLQRLLLALAKDKEMVEAALQILQGNRCLRPDWFYRLRSAGVMAGHSHEEAHPRCRLYAEYLGRHLST